MRQIAVSFALLLAVACGRQQSATPDQKQSATPENVLPRPEQPFGGKIGRTTKESTPGFPAGQSPRRRARRTSC